jgi:uncharacterized damage-inducible protein DinB
VLTLPSLLDLYRHMEWADATVHRAARAADGPSPDALLHGLLHHLHFVQRAFLSVWTGGGFPEGKPIDHPTLAALADWARPYYAGADRFLSALPPERLAHPVRMPWIAEFEQHLGRTLETPTLAETAFQVTSHSTYHRGQVNRRLRELGVEPPLVDYIAWVWFGRPQPDWTGTRSDSAS